MTQRLVTGQDRGLSDTAPDPVTTPDPVTARHAIAAAHIVMLGEIAWFRTLADDTLELIATSAPEHSPEYECATAELERRAGIRPFPRR